MKLVYEIIIVAWKSELKLSLYRKNGQEFENGSTDWIQHIIKHITGRNTTATRNYT